MFFLTIQLHFHPLRRFPFEELNESQVPDPSHLLHFRPMHELRQHLEDVPIVQRHMHVPDEQRPDVVQRVHGVRRVLGIGPDHFHIAIEQATPADRRLLFGPDGRVVRRKVDERKATIALVHVAFVDDHVGQLGEHLLQHGLDGRHGFVAREITDEESAFVVGLLQVERVERTNEVVLEHVHRFGRIRFVDKVDISESSILVAEVHHQPKIVDWAELLEQTQQLHFVHVLGNALQEQLTLVGRRFALPVDRRSDDLAAIHANALHFAGGLPG